MELGILEKIKQCNRTIITEEVVEHILSCQSKVAEKIIRDIQLLDEYGLALGTDYIHRIGGSKYKLWELRTIFGKVHNRTLFFCVVNGKFLLANAFIKKTDKVPVKEIEKAERIYDEYLNEN